MTLQQVAQAAGVSASTVSRVLNASPGIAASTVDAVNKVVAEMAYTPTRRRRASPRSSMTLSRGKKVGFFIVHQQQIATVPAYDHLLRGVSNACNDLQLDLQVGFIESNDDFIPRLARQRFDGLVLHGVAPPSEVTKSLHDVPTVWLMGNRHRPCWGDQVMPDNGLIGQIAAQYLLRNGCRNVVYHGINSGWSMSLRSLAFQQAIEDAGAQVTILNPSVVKGEAPDAEDQARRLAALCAAPTNRPDGIFVAEDWILRSVYSAMDTAGVKIGGNLSIISCNNDRPYLLGLSPTPATIDIRFERIGYRGVEQLVNRLQRNDKHDRVRIMIEPSLVAPPATPAAE